MKTIDKIKPLKSGAGFTLIELLVVIAVISLLASVVLVALNSARKKSRIARRAADLSQIAKALELYYDANNNAYPAIPPPYRTECVGQPGTITVSADQVIPGLSPTYISKFPADPAMKASIHDSCYMFYSDGINYKLMDYNVSEMTQADYLSHPEFIDPLSDGGPAVSLSLTSCDGAGDNSNILGWAIYSRDARCW